MARKNRGQRTQSSASTAIAQSRQLTGQYREAAGDSYANEPARIGTTSNNLEGQGWYPLTRFTQQYMTLLAMYRSHWIVRKIVDAVAEDMMKDKPVLNCDLKPEAIKKFDKVMRDTATQEKMLVAVKWGRLFGGGVAVICVEGHEDLSKPLKLDDVDLNSYKGLIPLDRWSGVFPDAKMVTDFAHPREFGNPESYSCTFEGNQVVHVHHTRLLRFTGRPLPEWERQVEMYWGLSEIEVVFDELQKRDYTSWNIVSLVTRAQILAVKDETLAQSMSGASKTNEAYNRYVARMSSMSQSMNNQGLMVVGEKGGIESHQYSFGGLSDIYNAFMADIAGAAEIPMSRLYGRTTSGLGNSGEGDLQIYYDLIDTKRNREVGPAYDKLLPIIAMSTFGKVPEDFDYTLPPSRTMSSKELNENTKDTAKAILDLYTGDLLTKQEARMELKQSGDSSGMFSNITDEALAETPDEYASEAGGGELDGMMGEGEEDAPEPPAGKQAPGKQKAAKDADPDFKETDHPRDKGGKFTAGAGAAGGGSSSTSSGSNGASSSGETKLSPNLQSIAKTFKESPVFMQSYNTAGKFVLHLTDKGGFTKQEIADLASTVYGTKTNVASVNWYLNKAKKSTPEGKKAEAAKQAGIKTNDAAIKAAETAPMKPEQVTEQLIQIEKKDWKSYYVHAKDDSNKTTYLKVTAPAELVSDTHFVNKMLASQGLKVFLKSPWDSSKPTPPNVKEFSPDVAEVTKLKDDALKAAQEEAEKKAAASKAAAEAKKPVTETEEELPLAVQQSIKHYTNGSYKTLNSCLRKGQPLEASQAKLAADLDKVIRKSKLTKDMVLYRGMDHPEAILGPNPKVGMVILDNGFISTAKVKDSSFGGALKMKISVKAGTHAIDVQSLSLHPGEAEVLLPRGAMFKILGISAAYGSKEVEVEYLNPYS